MKVSPIVLPGMLLYCALLPVLASAQQASEQAQASASAQTSLPQDPSATPQANQQPPAEKDKKPDAKPAEATSKDRLFYALPNFLTLESSDKVPPLTAKEKFKVVTRSAFDPVQLPWYAFLAGVSQADNSEKGFGQGAAGYGKRLGANAADGTIENFMTGAILPSLLRQDPRYFQSGKGGFFHRAVYSVSRILITRTDSGHQQFNYSEVVGSALASGISTYSYHPHEDQTLQDTVSVWGSQVGYDTITLVVREFWPDIRRKLNKKHKQAP